MVRRTFRRVLSVAVVAVFGFVTVSGDLFAQGRRRRAFGRARGVQERHTERFMARKGIVGTAAQVFRRRKAPREPSAAGEGVPEAAE